MHAEQDVAYIAAVGTVCCVGGAVAAVFLALACGKTTADEAPDPGDSPDVIATPTDAAAFDAGMEASDCATPARPGVPIWAKTFEETAGAAPIGLHRCGDGLCLAGELRGTLSITEELVSMGMTDAYLAKFTDMGEPLWSRRLGGIEPADRVILKSMGADREGRLAVAGSFDGTLIFGGEDGPSVILENFEPDHELFVAGLNDVGALRWYRSLGWTTSVPPHVVLTTDVSGNVIVAAATSANFEDRLVVAGIDPLGGDLFQWTADGFFQPTDLAVGRTGDIVLVGFCGRDLILPAVEGPSVQLEAGSSAICVIALDASGRHLWSYGFEGDYQPARAPQLALDAADNVVLAGSFGGSLNFDISQAMPALVSAGESDIYIARFSASGEFQWQSRIGGPDSQVADLGLSTTDTGAIVIAADSRGELEFGSGHVPPWSGSMTVFLAELEADGRLAWSSALGGHYASGGDSVLIDTQRDSALYFATDYSGDLIPIAGDCRGSVSYGLLLTRIAR
jgi:hypothetical protein